MVKKYQVKLFFLTLAIILFVSGCFGEKKKEPPKLHLVAPESTILKLLNIPLYVALEQDYFTEQGLNFSLEYVKTNDLAIEKIKKGEANAAYLNIEATIIENKKDSTAKLTNFYFSFRGLGAYLLARESMPSFQWSELKKASIIGHNLGSFPEMTLENQLRQNELIPQENLIIFRNIPFSLMPGAFKAGIGNYLLAFQPWASEFENAKLGYIVTSLDSKIIDFPLQSFVSSKNFLEKHPQASQKFANGLYKAQLWLNKYSSTQIRDLVEDHFEELDKGLLLTIIDKYKQEGYWESSPVPTKENLDSLQDILIAGGAIREKISSESMIYSKYTEKAVKTVTLPIEKKKTWWDKVKDIF